MKGKDTRGKKCGSCANNNAVRSTTHIFFGGGASFTNYQKLLNFRVLIHLVHGDCGGLAMLDVGIPYKAISSDNLDAVKKKSTLSEWGILMRHISKAIEVKMNKPIPEIRDETKAIERL
ncbi:hypothetical protein GQ600_19892 [Phytophthora cactorum]|nr:hypothetical protein GQ600_19892 [Phytophthora cactorum]